MNSRGNSLKEIVKNALNEDIGKGDITSLASLEPMPVEAKVTAKSDGILSGLIPALMVFEIVDSANEIRALKKDGDKFQKGDIILEIKGFNQTVFIAERTALNFLGLLSGIASETNRYSNEIKNYKCKILDTRKTTPGLRELEKKAVKDGGGVNHRMGLYDMILIKDNHIASAGSITKAITSAREYLNTSDFRLQFDKTAEDIQIEVEVTTSKELKEAISCGIKRLLLDNQSNQQLKKMVTQARQLDSNCILEASGNITLKNAAAVASTGVDFISVGSITHSAPITDFSLTVL